MNRTQPPPKRSALELLHDTSSSRTHSNLDRRLEPSKKTSDETEFLKSIMILKPIESFGQIYSPTSTSTSSTVTLDLHLPALPSPRPTKEEEAETDEENLTDEDPLTDLEEIRIGPLYPNRIQSVKSSIRFTKSEKVSKRLVKIDGLIKGMMKNIFERLLRFESFCESEKGLFETWNLRRDFELSVFGLGLILDELNERGSKISRVKVEEEEGGGGGGSKAEERMSSVLRSLYDSLSSDHDPRSSQESLSSFGYQRLWNQLESISNQTQSRITNLKMIENQLLNHLKTVWIPFKNQKLKNYQLDFNSMISNWIGPLKTTQLILMIKSLIEDFDLLIELMIEILGCIKFFRKIYQRLFDGIELWSKILFEEETFFDLKWFLDWIDYQSSSIKFLESALFAFPQQICQSIRELFHS